MPPSGTRSREHCAEDTVGLQAPRRRRDRWPEEEATAAGAETQADHNRRGGMGGDRMDDLSDHGHREDAGQDLGSIRHSRYLQGTVPSSCSSAVETNTAVTVCERESHQVPLQTSDTQIPPRQNPTKPSLE